MKAGWLLAILILTLLIVLVFLSSSAEGVRILLGCG